MVEINLLPGAQRRTRRGGPTLSLGAIQGLAARAGNRYVLGGSATVVLGLLAIGAMYTFQQQAADVVALRESDAARDSTRYAAVLAARRTAETARDSLYQQLAIIKSIDDSRFTWPHILQAVNHALPQYTWLTSVAQTSAVTTSAGAWSDTAAGKPGAAARPGGVPPAKRSGRQDAAARSRQIRARADSLFSGTATTIAFRIVGQTVDIQALTRFMKALEASPFIRDVRLTRSDLITSESQQITEFQLEARSTVPPAEAVQTIPLAIAVQ